MACSSSFSREAGKGNVPLLKFQQVMKNIKKKKKKAKLVAQIKHLRGPEVAHLEAASLQSVTKLMSFQQKWQEAKQERLAGTT